MLGYSPTVRVADHNEARASAIDAIVAGLRAPSGGRVGVSHVAAVDPLRTFCVRNAYCKRSFQRRGQFQDLGGESAGLPVSAAMKELVAATPFGAPPRKYCGSPPQTSIH